MDYSEKLDLIINKLDALDGKISADAKPVEPIPPAEGGLYQYIRPLSGVPRYGYGVRMTSPNVNEARLRSMYCVKWNGELSRTGAFEDECWFEIEALKKGDPGLIEKYKMLDPDFAGFGLLTGLFDVVKYDGFIGAAKREAWAGWTVEQFINQQFGIDSRPSGNDE